MGISPLAAHGWAVPAQRLRGRAGDPQHQGQPGTVRIVLRSPSGTALVDIASTAVSADAVHEFTLG